MKALFCAAIQYFCRDETWRSLDYHQGTGLLMYLQRVLGIRFVRTQRTSGYFGKQGSVAYFDFSKDKYCLTDKHHHDEYIGCFDDEERATRMKRHLFQSCLKAVMVQTISCLEFASSTDLDQFLQFVKSWDLFERDKKIYYYLGH